VHLSRRPWTPKWSPCGSQPFGARCARTTNRRVKDVARGIASLQTAERLNHGTYNIGNGRSISDWQVIAALNDAFPEAHLDLMPGRVPSRSEETHLDISRLEHDTGYQPTYGLIGGIADYTDWLRTHDY
jgi:UDP-glucose 4-epimerase